jgi:hypothetical protein
LEIRKPVPNTLTELELEYTYGTHARICTRASPSRTTVWSSARPKSGNSGARSAETRTVIVSPASFSSRKSPWIPEGCPDEQ